MRRRVLLILLTLGLVFCLLGPAMAGKKRGLFSSSSTDISGTTGVRGGDVMGDAIKGATPDRAAVQSMEQRSIPTSALQAFQREGGLGPRVGGHHE